MALYRFLFAPVLLAAAVIAGPRGERAPEPARAEPPAAHARVAAVPGANALPAVHHLPAGAAPAEARRAAGR